MQSWFNVRKSIYVIHCATILKEKKYIISIDLDKTFKNHSKLIIKGRNILVNEE